MINPTHETDGELSSPSAKKVGARLVSGAVCAALAVAFVATMGGTASASTGQTSSGDTQANVAVPSAITLTGLTPSFTLTGLPRATVTGTEAVTMNVETNNLGGYVVTVQSNSATLAPNTSSNPDSIPIADLRVRESGTGDFTPLSDHSAVTVHAQETRSAEGGDSVSNDYQVAIPFVNEDTYSTTLDYVATTL